MAKGDRVGALYYEVILDPRGFARGAAKTKHEQDLLVRAVKSGVSEIDRLKAEQIAVGKRLHKATGDEKQLLERYYDSLTKKIRRATKARQEEAKAARETRKVEAKRRLLTAKSKGLFGGNALGGKTAANLRLMRMEFKQGSAAASKLFGNMAQAAGLSPMLQGLARTVGLLPKQFALAALGLIAFTAAIVKTTMAYDRYMKKLLQLKPLMGGNLLASKGLSKQMEELARRTSFTVEQLQDITISMRTMGVEASRIPKLAERFGGLVSGDPEKLKLAVKAYTDVLAKGKLAAQEVNQFANAGIPLWQALSDSMGKTRAEVRAMAEDGEITAQDLDRALEKFAETIGAEENLAANMKTISGQMQAAGQSIAEMMRDVGSLFHDEMLMAAKALKTGIEAAAAAVKPLVRGLQKIEDISRGKILEDEDNFKQRTIGGDGPEVTLLDRIIGLPDDIKERSALLEESMKQAYQNTLREIEAEEALEEKRKKGYESLLEDLDNKLRTEEQIANRKFEAMLKEKLLAEDITEEQAKQARQHREMVLGELERQEAAEKRAKAEKEILDAQAEEAKTILDEFNKYKDEIEDRLKDARKRQAEAAEAFKKKQERDKKEFTGNIDKANADGAASFDAGSVAEFQFLRQMELQARRDQMVDAWEKQAAIDRRAMRNSMQQIARNQSKQAAEDISDLEDSYFGPAGAP